MSSTHTIEIHPRKSYSRAEFEANAPDGSIALDGIVGGGPWWNAKRWVANFDHHEGCVREATMSTCKQVLFAVKGGMMDAMCKRGPVTIFVNDPDQDTAFASWLLLRHRRFEGVQSHPTINRLLELTDRWDITGGAFPTALDDSVIQTHAWVFDPYTSLRVSGALATAGEAEMRNCLAAVHQRLDAVLLGEAGRKPLREDATVLHKSPHGYDVIDETGGNEARYLLFSKGMNAFVSLVATRPDGRRVYSIGRRSRYIPFPVNELYDVLNAAEPEETRGWGGSDIIGGSARATGSSLPWPVVSGEIDRYLCSAEGLSFVDLAAPPR